MRKQLPYLLLVPFLLSLPSCGSNGNTSSTGNPSESSPKSEAMYTSENTQSSSEESPILSYVDKATPAQVYEPEVETDVNLRFYSDHPKVPYMNIRDYYSLLLDRDFKVEKKDGGIYELTAFTGAKATVDVESDKLVSGDFSEFINTTIFRDEKSKNVYYDGTPYVRFNKTQANQKPLEVVLDFAKYHIDIRSDDKDVYMPFVTLSDIFKGMTMVQSFYDGKKVYVIDSNSDYSGSRYANDSTVLSNIEEAFSINGERDEDLSEFNYNELCFNFDHFYGLPGREVLHDDLIRYGLDKALEIHSPSSRVTKAYLKSTHADEFLAGMALLNDFLGDGGHTVVDSGVKVYLSNVAAIDYERYMNIQTLYDRNRIKENALDKKIYTYFAVNNLRKEVFGEDNSFYHSKGDTAIYSFNQFDYNLSAWKDYYAQKGVGVELPDDSVGNFIRACQKANADNKIKNMVIDLANNGGGSADVVFYLFQAMTGVQAYLHNKDTLTHQEITTYYDVDINLDGKFDQNDLVKPYDLNFGILSSGFSFSCGNLLPAMCKENGILLLGEKSGGGACAVYDGATADGIYYRFSCPSHLITLAGTSVDAGVTPHYNLIKGNVEKTPTKSNYEDFFNFEKLSQCFDEFYSSND